MNWLARYVFRLGVAIILCYIISMLWLMAEVKLYGYSQESIIDTLAAATLAYGIADFMVGGE